jgi:hypothetical protein
MSATLYKRFFALGFQTAQEKIENFSAGNVCLLTKAVSCEPTRFADGRIDIGRRITALVGIFFRNGLELRCLSGSLFTRTLKHVMVRPEEKDAMKAKSSNHRSRASQGRQRT